ncbi:alpha-amylase family protein [Robiginitalea sp. IMCC44478]|uniref:alpha-amylase family protein n=1 Tax=Robiginitalea sp. IMCC44478 TaxID=3459122 RepID=UPI0040418716
MNQSAIHRLLGGKRLENPKKTDLLPLFEKRLAANLSLIQELFFSLYPNQTYGMAFEELLALMAKLFKRRPEDLKIQDLQRLGEGNWYQRGQWIGMQLYVDRFCGDLKGLEEKLPYLEKLGINFLHLMPLTKRPKGQNDGGYAVNSYTEIDPVFGTDADLTLLTKKFREKGICLMLDFVVNHTSDEYPWALSAKKGNPEFQQYYYTYADRTIPDLFEVSLPEVFPETSPGNFTYDADMQRWVMTVFNHYQWDLNYTNPEVFMAMLENLVELSNKGVDVIRFDALAFLWKRIGTDSQNLPEAHRLISLFRMCLQVVAPGAVILAEAIVSPQQIVRYFGEGIYQGNECELAYNATYMACLWDSIATKKTRLLYRSLETIPAKPKMCTWVNYVRCHDDIGLGFDDRNIAELGWNPGDHRRFLLDYYCQRLEWSPAKGAVFMYNPLTGDGRITGSTASLLGLEKALEEKDSKGIDQALDKILLLYGSILAFPGIPLVYAGDEIAMLNDYSYLTDPAKADDSRWVNRPVHDWEAVSNLRKRSLPSSRVFQKLKKLIALRKEIDVLTDTGNLRLLDSGNEHLLVFERHSEGGAGLLLVGNFDENPQVLNASWLESLGYLNKKGNKNLVNGKTLDLNSGLLEVSPYDLLWLLKV